MLKDQKSRLPLLAIVGRPNVGKSTLFNRLIGSRRAIVGDEPGITRDRLYGETTWDGRRLRIVDTGGIVPDDKDFIPGEIFRQARLALDIAQLETKKAEAGHKPTVDLQAGYVVNRYPNGSVTPQIGTSYRTNAASVGVVMNLPLFAGFAVQNRIKETLALEDKARAQLERRS